MKTPTPHLDPKTASIAPDKAEPAGERVISMAELSEITGLTRQRHEQLVQAGHIPKAKRGLFPLVETLRGVVTYYRQAAARAKVSAGEAKQTKTLREIELLDMEIALKKEELLPAVDVQNYLMDIFHALKCGVMASSLQRHEQGILLDDLRRLGMAVPVREHDATEDEDGEQELTPPQ